MSVHEESKQELFRCSRCTASMLLKFFEIYTSTGRRYKTCTKCRSKYKCDRDGCSKAFPTRTKLNRHIKSVHDKVKNHACVVPGCGRRCASKSNLNKHTKQVHDRIRDHVCDTPGCDQAFSFKGNLNQHIKDKHDKVKDHACAVAGCEYACSSTSNLNQHTKQVHDRIRDHLCDTVGCDQAFSFSGSLKAHKLICKGKGKGSGGEKAIKRMLTDMNISYLHDTSFEVKASKPLRWDFIIHHEGKPYFIEYDGKHHFKPVRFGGRAQAIAEVAFEKQKRHDAIKDKYCVDNGYTLLRIPYTDIANIPQIVAKFAIDCLDWGDAEDARY